MSDPMPLPMPLEVALDALDPSAANDRDAGDLGDLTASVRAHGILQPLVVRPKGKGRFEVVCGHRRRLAALELGLQAVPSVCCEMTDAQAAEIRLIENLQRADLRWWEEAVAFLQLVQTHGRNPEEIVRQVGKSPAYVAGRLRLAQLPPKVRQLLAKREAPVQVAVAIGRIASPTLQLEAAQEVTAVEKRWSHAIGGHHEVPRHTTQGALDFLRKTYALRLADAPFDPKDAQLLPAAGPCTTCPKSSGAQPALFEDLRGGEHCTDRSCWKEKAEAHCAARLEALAAGGARILKPKEAKLHEDGRPAWGSPYVRAEDSPAMTTSRKSWEKLLKANAPPAAYAKTSDGKIVKFLREAEAMKAAQAAGYAWAKTGGGRGGRAAATPADKARRKRELAAARLTAAQELAVCEAIAAAGEKLPGTAPAVKLPRQLLEVLCLSAMVEVWSDHVTATADRRGFLESKRAADRYKGVDALKAWAKAPERKAAELAGLLCELLAPQRWQGKVRERMAEALGVPVARVRGAVKREQAKAVKAKAAKRKTTKRGRSGKAPAKRKTTKRKTRRSR